MEFDRQELIELRARSAKAADAAGTTEAWRRAYMNLADAADRLDAMIARCTIPAEEKEER